MIDFLLYQKKKKVLEWLKKTICNKQINQWIKKTSDYISRKVNNNAKKVTNKTIEQIILAYLYSNS